MKIDPKLKQRIRFTQMDEDARKRLRRFYHYTSASAALQILQSGFIWSDADDICPNFCSNREPAPIEARSQEVCLAFQFAGTAHLVEAQTPSSEYTTNGLYIHLHRWPDMFGLEGLRVAQLRVSLATATGLEFRGLQIAPAYQEQCRDNLEASMVLSRLKRLGANRHTIRVPQSAEERETVRKRYPEPSFSRLDVWKMKFERWRKSQQKKKSRS